MEKRNYKTKGFTLIEILVAMTIVAVLMAISLVSLTGARKVARDGKRKADLEQIRSALEIYRSDCAAYPGDLNTLLSGCTGEVYLAEVPLDPFSSSGPDYVYTNTSSNSYTLCAYLEADQDTNYSSLGQCPASCDEVGFPCYYKTSNY